ncbi:MAG: hypothetical protein MH137_03240 [Flavobacteriales bacterium]|nr:hypothetical protein [Flavobacteriales bacterium]
MTEGSVNMNVEIARLQKEIAERLTMPSENLIWEFSDNGDIKVLDLITVNPAHRQSFLFHSTQGFSKVDALYEMLKYVKNYKEIDNSYTIQWSIKGNEELHTSYFRAGNLMDALKKFSYGRDINSTVIFSITLNPIS